MYNPQLPFNPQEPLPHGGRLNAAAAFFAVPLDHWLDLSTGINVCGWPIQTPPASTWMQLPEEDDGLIETACQYYGTSTLLPVAGSQAAIQALPQLRPHSCISVLSPGYAEHAHAWKRHHHKVSMINAAQIDHILPETDVLIIINPNNPTGETFSPAQLLNWHTQLAKRGGWLIVDEAFMDATPEHSIAAQTTQPGLIVLRSLGKFFGLAGARVGFICAHPDLLTMLKHTLGPWAVNTPARWVAIQALKDQHWQINARTLLKQKSQRLAALLTRHHLNPTGGCAFFHWVQTKYAEYLFEKLAFQGILVRHFITPSSVRFGIPDTEINWHRLDQALTQINQQHLCL